MSLPTTLQGLNEALRRRFGTQDGPMLSIGSDLFPIVKMGDDDIAPELLFLTGGRRASQFRSIAPTAGQFAEIGFFTGGGVSSTTIAVVEAITLQAAAPCTFQIRKEAPAATALSGVIQGTPWDGRLPGLAAGIIGSNSNASSTPGTALLTLPGTTSHTLFEFRHGIVVTPGTNLRICCQLASTTITCGMIWRERKIETWEAGA